ncbi:MAG: transporter substrate-binding domain-containing protein, partial [Eggerthellaceae bacterium]|nr:transporter substrate-binding domain-containing protein [Eggerthellaceae bacterium]
MKNIKKKAAAFAVCALAACLGAFALAGCGQQSSSTQSSSASKTLTVGFDQSYPPYGFVADDGSYTGFDLDLAKEVC